MSPITGRVDILIDRLTGTNEPPGYDRGSRRPCPVWGQRDVWCDPDGTLLCEACDDIYLGRFSDDWFAYAVWLRDKSRVRLPFDAE